MLLVVVVTAYECEICQPGSFCYSDNKYTCPSNSKSLENSSNVSACVCDGGYSQSLHNHSCELCVAGTWCKDEVIHHCPTNSSSFAGSNELTDCKCEKGYTGLDGQNCTICTQNTYKDRIGKDACSPCLSNQVSLNGSKLSTDCKCNLGYSGADGGICNSCLAGKYKDVVGSSACKDCTSGSISPVNSITDTLCVCQAGFSYDISNNSCNMCVTGKYKTSIGNTPCDSCQSNSHTMLPGQTHVTACLCNAGFGFVSVNTQNTCVECTPGKFSPGNVEPCDVCATGHYAAGDGNSKCDECGTNEVAVEPGQFECQSCPSFSVTVSNASNAFRHCMCDKGYTGSINSSTDECVPCISGKYKPLVSSLQGESCTACSKGSKTTESGSTFAEDCIECSEEEYGELDSTGAAICLSCSDGTQISKTLEVPTGQCICRVGYEYRELKCTLCQAGKAKGIVGDSECQTCTSGKFSASGQSTCTGCQSGTYEQLRTKCESCPVNSSSLENQSHITHCICLQGFSRESDACTICPAGHYEDADNCIPCDTGKYSDTVGANDDLVCHDCPTNAISGAGSSHISQCECKPGFSGSPCTKCVNGTWKDTTGSESCTNCDPNTYWPVQALDKDSNKCHACPQHSTSSPQTHDIANCDCDEGHKRTNDTCELCAAGKYCAGANYLEANCPMYSNSSIGSTLIADCVCDAGYYGDSGNCTICPVNSFCVGGLTSPESCSDHATTRSQSGTNSVTGCICDHGYYEFSTNCVICPRDSYCYDDQNFTCISNSTAVMKSDDASDCMCDPGFGILNGTCVLCADNVLCGGVVIDFPLVEVVIVHHKPSTRRLLTFDWFSPYDIQTLKRDIANATNISESQVFLTDITYTNESGVDGSTVRISLDILTPDVETARVTVLILQNHSNPAIGSIISQRVLTTHSFVEANNKIQQYPEIAVETNQKPSYQCSQYAENENENCVCRPGSWCSDTSASGCIDPASCVDCEEDSYCLENKKNACPEHESSPADSGTRNDCRCVEGFYRNNGLCMPCPLHSYCTNEILYPCTEFDGNMITFETHQSSLSACHCNTGFFRFDLHDVCTPCPLDFYCPSEFLVFECMQFGFTPNSRSTRRDQCTCRAGFHWRTDSIADACLECVNQICSGSEIVQFCDEGKVANIDHSKCVCEAGSYPLNFLDCISCPSGYAKELSGDIECEICATGKYAKNLTHCEDCRPGEDTRVPGSTFCKCDEPTISNSSGFCEACPVNSYYDTSQISTDPRNRGVCTICQTSSSTSGLDNQVGPDACVCDRGYERTGNSHDYVCQSCPSNTFEKNGECVDCGINASSPETSTTESDCKCLSETCEFETIQPSKILGRHCLKKCDDVRDVCKSCSVGKFKNTISNSGNQMACQSCVHGKFQGLTGQDRCNDCAPNRYHHLLAESSNAKCSCVLGHEPQDDNNKTLECIKCKPGHFKVDNTDTFCIPCAIGKFQPSSGQSSCISCSSNSGITNADTTLSSGSISPDNCTCAAGSELSDNTCQVCQQGSFKDTAGIHNCTLCGSVLAINSYGDASNSVSSDAHCSQCSPNSGMDRILVNRSNFMTTIDDCLCFPGFERNDITDTCTTCEDYKIKIGYGNEQCSFCNDGYYYSEFGCNRCILSTQSTILFTDLKHMDLVVNSIDTSLKWGVDQEDCECEVGYERVSGIQAGSGDDICAHCTPGKYRNSIYQETCEHCPKNQYTTVTHGINCLACPSNSKTINNGSTDITDCRCDEGYKWNVDSCVACEAGKIRPKHLDQGTCIFCLSGFYQESTAQTHCDACPLNEISYAPFSDPSTSCRCKPGFGNDEHDSCESCEIGKYSIPTTSSVPKPFCRACPGNKTTNDIENEQINDCHCRSGYGIASLSAFEESCLVCGDGKYATGGLNEPCISCGQNTVTEPSLGSFSFDHCQCNNSKGYK